MKFYVVIIASLFISFGAAALWSQFTDKFPIPTDGRLTANENLAFALAFLALGLWGAIAFIVAELKERL